MNSIINHNHSRSFWALLALFFVASTAFSAPQSIDPKQVEIGLKSVNALISTSSISQHVRSSKNKGALAQLKKAATIHKKAVEAFRSKDYKTAEKLLVEAKKEMFKGVKLAGFSKSSSTKKENDFKHKLKSVKAMTKSVVAVSAEDGVTAKGNEVIKDAEAKVKRGKKAWAAGKKDEGLNLVSAALDTLNVFLKSRMQGEHKVILIDFETKEDEYEYVKRFNDDYVKMVVEFIREVSSRSSDHKGLLAKMKTARQKGKQIRKKAEKEAGSGKFESAVKTMEDSTRSYKKVFRLLGYPIP